MSYIVCRIVAASFALSFALSTLPTTGLNKKV